MLTTPPGSDIAPYHNRQIATLDHADWATWLAPLRFVMRLVFRVSLGRVCDRW